MGGFILSINDTPQIRKTFAAFSLAPVTLNYSISNGTATQAHELIVTPPGLALKAEAAPDMLGDGAPLATVDG